LDNVGRKSKPGWPTSRQSKSRARGPLSSKYCTDKTRHSQILAVTVLHIRRSRPDSGCECVLALVPAADRTGPAKLLSTLGDKYPKNGSRARGGWEFKVSGFEGSGSGSLGIQTQLAQQGSTRIWQKTSAPSCAKKLAPSSGNSLHVQHYFKYIYL
jgi:hypothetical protein